VPVADRVPALVAPTVAAPTVVTAVIPPQALGLSWCPVKPMQNAILASVTLRYVPSRNAAVDTGRSAMMSPIRYPDPRLPTLILIVQATGARARDVGRAKARTNAELSCPRVATSCRANLASRAGTCVETLVGGLSMTALQVRVGPRNNESKES
jgi:hypothetical protein